MCVGFANVSFNQHFLNYKILGVLVRYFARKKYSFGFNGRELRFWLFPEIYFSVAMAKNCANL